MFARFKSTQAIGPHMYVLRMYNHVCVCVCVILYACLEFTKLMNALSI